MRLRRAAQSTAGSSWFGRRKLYLGRGVQTIGIMEDLIDARSLILTPNSTTVYVLYCTNLETGPLVVEVPQGVIGFLDDA